MEIKVGEVENYYSKIGVIILRLNEKLNVGDTIHIKGYTTDFMQVVNSMQIEHKDVKEANPGDSVGIKVNEKVRKGDVVYKVIP